MMEQQQMRMKKVILLFTLLLGAVACTLSDTATPQQPSASQENQPIDNPVLVQQIVPNEERWGIYRLDLETQTVELIYSSPVQISSLRLNGAGDRFVFSQKVGGEDPIDEEIFTLGANGQDLRQITDNEYWDLYPAWSPDSGSIAFLSLRSSSLGIWFMQADGSDASPLYDSSSHEADIDWRGDQIVFTKDSSLWIMQSDGSEIRQLTHPPRAGEWGKANLPFGDYDPRLSPDGTKVIFERLVGDQTSHGNYDLFIVDSAGSNELALTRSGYSQGLASWSNSGTQIVFVVSAIGETGQYDLYLIAANGGESRNITPSYFPPQFLCHWAIFSSDDTSIYLIGEWWPTE